MKIYARTRESNEDKKISQLVGKDIWILAHVGRARSLLYIKIIDTDDTKIYYYSISATHINGLDLPSDAAVDVCKEAILSDLKDYETHPEWYSCCAKSTVTLLNTAYTTEELYELAEGEE